MIYKANILVIDDDIPVCKSIAGILEHEGYGVEMAFNGEKAIETQEKEKFAVIMLDLMLPDIRGLELLEKIKEKNPDVSVIIMTGYPSIKTAVQSIKLGAFDYLPKPFTPVELRSIVGRALERRFIYEEVASKMSIGEKKLVDISIPPGLHCIKEHSWVKIDSDRQVRFGIHHMLVRMIKDIADVEFPKKYDNVTQGEVCVKITDSQDHAHRIWAPLSGQVIAINEEIKKDYAKVIYDPYEAGWLILVKPDNLEDEIKNIEILTSL